MKNNQKKLALLVLFVLLSAAGYGMYRSQQRELVAPVPPQEAPATDMSVPSEQVARPTEAASDNPRDWFLTVPIGPDGNALPPARKGDAASVVEPIRFRHGQIVASTAVYRPGYGRPEIILARGKAPSSGPVKLVPIGPGTHSIGPKGSGGKQYGAGPGGGKSYSDGDRSERQDPTSSWDFVDKYGHTHLEPPGADGSYSGYLEDNNGNRRNFKIGADGSTELENGDGTVERFDKDGNHSIDLDGLPPTPRGPGGTGDGGAGGADGSEADRGGNGGNRGAGGVGEPHFLTFDGTAFSTQVVGEFILAQGVAGQDLHIRMQPYKDSRAVSAIAGFAMRAGGAEIEVLLDGNVRIDGALVGPGAALRYDLIEGGALGLWREGDSLKHVVLIWPDLSTLWIDRFDGFMNFAVQWRKPEPARLGLLGRDDNDAGNDLTLRDLTVADAEEPAAVNAYVESWRLSDAESLFSYKDSESTESFTDLNFPYEEPILTHTDKAERLCDDLVYSFSREACLFDVAVTGSEDFATAAAAIDQQLATFGLPKTKDPVVAIVETESCNAARDDLASAAPLEAERVDVTLTAEASQLYRFDTTGGISVITHSDSSDAGPYAEGQPAYCILSSNGETVIPLTHSGTDSYFSRNDQGQIPAGTYYLKAFGPGRTDLSLTLNQH